MYYEFISTLSDLPDELAKIDLSETRLNNYKLPLISSLANARGAFVEAMDQMVDSLRGYTPATHQAMIENVKQASIDTVLASADQMRDLIANSTCVVLASPDALEEHADLFDEIYQL